MTCGSCRSHPPELHEMVWLTAVDWSLIHAHPLASPNMLGEFGPVEPLVADAVLHHHERPARKGYPQGIEPTVSALVVAVADCWDALTASRPYRREPFSRRQALDEIARWAPAMLVGMLDQAAY
jgi:HD-GYP domain-containing protein (c-di-GMP phosphodiesterase class II)